VALIAAALLAGRTLLLWSMSISTPTITIS
jgi:hypothetical protein